MPVIVVRPSSKRDKARDKRANDPDRQTYRKILEKSESLIDVNSPRNSFFANEDEAHTLAKAIANKQAPDTTHPLAQVASAPASDDDHETNVSTIVDDLRNPPQLMKSPHLQNLDSPDFSDDPSSAEEDEDGSDPTKPTSSAASEIAKGRGALDIDDDGISPGTKTTDNPLEANRTNSAGPPTPEITITDPNDPSRVK